MKNTGIIRKVDELGRVVLPIEIREVFQINIKDPLEIYTDGGLIVLKKYEPGCAVCGSMKEMKTFRGKNICKTCVMGMP